MKRSTSVLVTVLGVLLIGYTHATLLMCVANGASVPCSQEVCPGARVEVVCNNTEASSNTLWKLPQGTCPTKDPPDTIALAQGSRRFLTSCGTASSTCGAFTARNNGADPQSNLCLTSVLTFNASSTTTFIQCGSGDVNNTYVNSSAVGSVNITSIGAPGTPSLATPVNDTSLKVTWATPTTGGNPTSYNVSINDSTGTTWTTPHDGSPSYAHTFAGLASNTLYSVTVVAINCAGNAGVTRNNYTLAEPPSAINGYCGLRGSSYSLNITWLPAINVTSYQITCLDRDNQKNYTRMIPCYAGLCNAPIDLDMAAKLWRICIGSYNKGAILGTANCTSDLEIDCPGRSPMKNAAVSSFDSWPFISLVIVSVMT